MELVTRFPLQFPPLLLSICREDSGLLPRDESSSLNPTSLIAISSIPHILLDADAQAPRKSLRTDE